MFEIVAALAYRARLTRLPAAVHQYAFRAAPDSPKKRLPHANRRSALAVGLRDPVREEFGCVLRLSKRRN